MASLKKVTTTPEEELAWEQVRAARDVRYRTNALCATKVGLTIAGAAALLTGQTAEAVSTLLTAAGLR